MSKPRVPQNLPPDSQQWVRDIERRLNDLETQNQRLTRSVTQNAGQLGALSTAFASAQTALSLATDIDTASNGGITAFPSFGSGASPFSHSYIVPVGYTFVSFMHSAWGRRAAPITSNTGPKWDMFISVNGASATSFTSTSDDDEFSGTFVGTVAVQPGDTVLVDSYCYMVAAGSQNVEWDANLILFAHN